MTLTIARTQTRDAIDRQLQLRNTCDLRDSPIPELSSGALRVELPSAEKQNQFIVPGIPSGGDGPNDKFGDSRHLT